MNICIFFPFYSVVEFVVLCSPTWKVSLSCKIILQVFQGVTSNTWMKVALKTISIWSVAYIAFRGQLEFTSGACAFEEAEPIESFLGYVIQPREREVAQLLASASNIVKNLTGILEFFVLSHRNVWVSRVQAKVWKGTFYSCGFFNIVTNPLVGTRIGATVGVMALMVFTAVFLYFPD